MPAGIWLMKYGGFIRDYFEHVPYLVGSSLISKKWRDVNVRLLVPDEQYAEWFGSVQSTALTNPRQAAVTLAWTAFGHQMTGGLPVDFQFQPASLANGLYGDRPRVALVELDLTSKPDGDT